MRGSKITDVKVGSSSLGVGKGLTIERIQVFVLEKSEVRCNREDAIEKMQTRRCK